VKPARFDYVRPESLDEALDALAAGGGSEAKVLAGGQSLVPALNMRLLRPTLLVDVNRVAGLDHVATEDGALRVGATVRQADLRLHAHPALAAVLPHVGHTVTRNRGTVCGSIAHADAAAELPLALVVSAIGLFFYTLINVTSAATMDVAGASIQASSFGLASLVTQILIIPTPIVAGYLIGIYGILSAFWISGIFLLLGAVTLVPLRLYRGTGK